MPDFRIHLRRGAIVEADELGLPFRDLHHAYLEACRAVPDTAREELVDGRDPMVCAFLICDARGRQLMEVPFSELLSPAEWRTHRAQGRPRGYVRSDRARDDLALAGFRRMFSAVDIGCILMTPELQIVEINAFCAQHSHVDADAIRDRSILDVFDLSGQPKRAFTNYIRLAQRGMTSELIDMPYVMLDAQGASVSGWWKARTWPIFDDDDHLLGLVEWAEPSILPTNGGRTLLRVAPGATR